MILTIYITTLILLEVYLLTNRYIRTILFNMYSVFQNLAHLYNNKDKTLIQAKKMKVDIPNLKEWILVYEQFITLYLVFIIQLIIILFFVPHKLYFIIYLVNHLILYIGITSETNMNKIKNKHDTFRMFNILLMTTVLILSLYE